MSDTPVQKCVVPQCKRKRKSPYLRCWAHGTNDFLFRDKRHAEMERAQEQATESEGVHLDLDARAVPVKLPDAGLDDLAVVDPAHAV